MLDESSTIHKTSRHKNITRFKRRAVSLAAPHRGVMSASPSTSASAVPKSAAAASALTCPAWLATAHIERQGRCLTCSHMLCKQVFTSVSGASGLCDHGRHCCRQLVAHGSISDLRQGVPQARAAPQAAHSSCQLVHHGLCLRAVPTLMFALRPAAAYSMKQFMLSRRAVLSLLEGWVQDELAHAMTLASPCFFAACYCRMRLGPDSHCDPIGCRPKGR